MVRPLEWLLSLDAEREAHRRLVDALGLPAAAFQYAQAKCQTREVPTEVPTRIDVLGAARELLRRAGIERDVPSSTSLARDCEAMGLLVI